MTLGKKTIDNSVKYIQQNEQVSTISKQRKKTVLYPRKQNETFSQNNGKFLEDYKAG